MLHKDRTKEQLVLEAEALRRQVTRLEEAELRYESLFDRLPVGLYRSTPAGQFLDVNSALVEMLGYPDRESLLAVNTMDLYAGVGDRRSWQASLESEGILTDFETQFRRHDGTVIWTRDHARVVRDAQGQVLYYEGSMEDITERKRAEEELWRLKELNEGIVQNMTEGIAVQDAEGFLTFINPAAASLLGYAPGELAGRYWTAVVPPDQQPIIQAADERRVQGKADRYEVELLHKDGTRIPVLISGSPRFMESRFDGTLAVFTDISERVQAEERLARHAREMAALYETSLEINSQPDLSTLLQAIVQRASELLGARMGALYLVRPGGEELEMVVSFNLPGDYAGTILRLGEGLSGRIAQTGEPMMVDDYSAWEGRAEVFAGDPFARVLGVPLKAADQVIGVINITDDEQEGLFDENEIRLVSLFADQAAIAIQNARLLAGERIAHEQADTVRAATQALTATLDLQEVFELILNELRRVVPYDSATVQQLQGDRLVIIGGQGFPNLEELLGISFDPEGRDNPNREVVRMRTPFILKDAPALYEEFKREPHSQAGIRSWLGVPLLFGDRLIGMIALDKKEPGFYTEEHAGLAMTFAAQAAIAIENARLFEAEREQRELAEALRKAAQVMGTSLELDEILRLLLEQLKRVLVYDTASVLILREGDVADLVAGIGYDDEQMTGYRAGRLLQESPILRQMARDLRPVISADVRRLEGWIWVPGAEHVRSWLAIPLVAQGRMIGVLMADHSQPDFFDEANWWGAQALAQHAAQAIENARLYQQAQQRLAELTLLFDTSAVVSTSLDADAVLDATARQISASLDVEGCTIYIWEREQDAIVCLKDYSPDPDWWRPKAPGTEYRLAEYPVSRKVLSERQPVTVQANDRDADPADLAWMAEQQIQSVLMVPMIVRDEPVGIMEIMQSVEGGEREFTPTEMALCQTLANQAAAALENARLYEETRRHNRELVLLNRVIAAVAARRKIDTILETVCRELALAFDVPQSAAALLNKEKTEVVVVAEYLAKGRPPSLGQAIPVKGNPSTEYLIEHKAPLVVDDARTDPGLEPIHELVRQRGTVSLLLLPLLVEGEVVGSLGVDAIEPRRFSAEEVDLAQRIADQVSGALARARLEENQRRLSTAVEQAAEAIVISEPDGTIAYVNPAFERITGYGRAQAVGYGLRVLQGDGPGAVFYRQLPKTVTAEGWQGQFTDTRADGSTYTVDSTVTPVRNDAGEIVNFVATMRDVTREVELEEQFIRAQKMEALGRLAGGIAHDFNNLLTVIHLSVKMMERQLHPEDPLWKHVQRIEETGNRAAKLTKQLLSFSRREIIEPQILNLNLVVEDLSRMLQRIIGENVELVTELADGLWPVKVDPAQMQQVIMNLVVNARDAMPQGGTLTIETSNVILDEAYVDSHVDAQPGRHLLLAITDTGVGMNDEVKGHLFEPFFTTKERGQGTGLGLPLVFGVVRQGGGHIRVCSQVGQGTTFKIYLPCTVGATVAGPVQTLQPITRSLVQGTETVLVVEDKLKVRDLVAEVLESCGYTVLAAASGPEALRISEQHEGAIHLLLTDLVMPHMNGQELAAQLQPQRPNMRVLYMSGYADTAIVQKGVPTPGVAFLPKPFSMEDLAHKVRAVLDSWL